MAKEISLLLDPINGPELGGGTVLYTIKPETGDSKYFKEGKTYFVNNTFKSTDFGGFVFNLFNRKTRTLIEEGFIIRLKRAVKDPHRPSQFIVKNLEDLKDFYKYFY